MWIRIQHSFVRWYVYASEYRFVLLELLLNVQPSEFPLLIVWIMDESMDALIKFIAFERFKIEIYSDFRHFTSILCRVAWNKPSDSIQSIFHAFNSTREAFEWSIYSSSEREYASIESTLFEWKHTSSYRPVSWWGVQKSKFMGRMPRYQLFFALCQTAFPPLTLFLQFKYSTQVCASVEKETEEQHLTSPNNNIHNYLFGPSMHIFIYCVCIPSLLRKSLFSFLVCMPFDMRSQYKTTSRITCIQIGGNRSVFSRSISLNKK